MKSSQPRRPFKGLHKFSTPPTVTVSGLHTKIGIALTTKHPRPDQVEKLIALGEAATKEIDKIMSS